MATQIDTSTAATATAYSNQRKVDRCQNGVLWALFWSAADTRWEFHYSSDDGATWSLGATQPNSPVSSTPNASFFIDADDYAHFVYKATSDGYIYYRRGTPNAERTAWTWTAATVVYNGGTDGDYPDVVAHREGTGWTVHGTYSRNVDTTFKAAWFRIPIDSAGTIGAVSSNNLVTTAYGNTAHSYPSIDFNHTGDGKTVAGSTPHLYAAWSAGVAGGIGIRFKKATYSSGAWTWGTERTIDGNHYWPGAAPGQTMFDGTRVIIVSPYSSTDGDVIIYERDAADTTTTTRVLVDNPTDAQVFFYPSSTYDGDGNVYLLGRRNDEAAGTHDLVYQKWTRATTTLEAEVVIDAGVGNPYVSAKRGFSNRRIEFIYTDGTASPYSVTYDSIILNAAPTAPTLGPPADGETIRPGGVTEWTHNDADGDPQVGFALVRKRVP